MSESADHDDGRCNVATCGRCAPLCCARMEHGGWCTKPDGHEGDHDGIGRQYSPTRGDLRENLEEKGRRIK